MAYVMKKKSLEEEIDYYERYRKDCLREAEAMKIKVSELKEELKKSREKEGK